MEATNNPMHGPPDEDVFLGLETDRMTQICEVVAKKIGRAVLLDMKHITEDIRQQYKDHNHILAKQELIMQQLLGEVHRLSPMSSKRIHPANGNFSKSGCGPWRLRTELCAEPETTASDDYDQVNSSSNGPHIVSQMHALAVRAEFDGSLSARGTPRTMCPRPSPAPPIPHPHPHPSKENSVNEDFGLAEAHFDVQSPVPGVKPCSGDDNCDLFEFDVADGLAERGPGLANGGHGSGRCSTDDDPPKKSNDVPRGRLEQSMNIRGTADRGSMQNPQSQGHGLFGDMQSQKNADLGEPDYNVANFYHETGICQMIARSDLFANITLGVIGANAIYIGVDADNNPAPTLAAADIGFQICENFFCVFFTFEWLSRFGAFARKRDCCKDNWFRFDSALVLMMVIETWVVPVAFAGSGGTGIPTGLVKMLRLLRLARMARLMRAFPELVAMMKGVRVASRAVGSALLMLVGLVYVFSIIMFTLLKDFQEDALVHERFHRLFLCMWTLLIDGTFLDGIGLISRALIDARAYLPLVFLMVFVLASALTVMNMLIGVLCEVVSAVAASEKEDNAIRMVKDKLLVMLKDMDEDGSGLISADEIAKVLDDPAALHTLASLQVDVKFLMDQLDMHFEDSRELTIHTIMDLILMLRGDRPPTMKDMLESLLFNRWKMGQSSTGTLASRGARPADDAGSEAVGESDGPPVEKRLSAVFEQKRKSFAGTLSEKLVVPKMISRF